MPALKKYCVKSLKHPVGLLSNNADHSYRTIAYYFCMHFTDFLVFTFLHTHTHTHTHRNSLICIDCNNNEIEFGILCCFNSWLILLFFGTCEIVLLNGADDEG